MQTHMIIGQKELGSCRKRSNEKEISEWSAWLTSHPTTRAAENWKMIDPEEQISEKEALPFIRLVFEKTD